MGTAFGQTPIYGLDLRGGDFFTTDPSAFAANYSVIQANFPTQIAALEFDYLGDNLYAIEHATSEIGTIDLTTGAWTSQRPSSLPLGSVTGLEMDARDGILWWAICFQGGQSELWRGDIQTGNFTLVGVIGPGRILDIAHLYGDVMYAHRQDDNSLITIHMCDATSSVVGPTGQMAAGAQGMNFDWFSGILHACLHTGAGFGSFAGLDLGTGQATVFENTQSLDAQMLLAFRIVGLSRPLLAFCEPAQANSSGFPSRLLGNFGSGSDSDLHLDAISGPPNQFGYFLVSGCYDDTGVQISQGRLCLSGAIGRYNVTGSQFNSIGQFDAAGQFQNFAGTSSVGEGFDVPTSLPLPGSPVIQAGSRWYFQLWHRDIGGAANFSNVLSAVFQ